ncbi:hypothetical protein Lal_00049391 [Lupinus albus]|nr:hypothetical protein Lal_00049391 [Lupinus albus]
MFRVFYVLTAKNVVATPNQLEEVEIDCSRFEATLLLGWMLKINKSTLNLEDNQTDWTTWIKKMIVMNQNLGSEKSESESTRTSGALAYFPILARAINPLPGKSARVEKLKNCEILAQASHFRPGEAAQL